MVLTAASRSHWSAGLDSLHRFAESLAGVARVQRGVDNLVVLAPLTDRAGARIERHLMGRSVGDGRIVPEDVLGAVAVMDVEIHDRDPLGAVRCLRAPRCDGGVWILERSATLDLARASLMPAEAAGTQ